MSIRPLPSVIFNLYGRSLAAAPWDHTTLAHKRYRVVNEMTLNNNSSYFSFIGSGYDYKRFEKINITGSVTTSYS